MNSKQRAHRKTRRQAHRRACNKPRDTLPHKSYPVVKQGHIVPASYQRNFATDEKVVVHFPGRADCVVLDVRNAGTRSRYYRRTRPDGTEIDDVEATLAHLEAAAAPILKDLAEGAPLDPEHKGVLMQFLAIQMLRGPAFFSTQRTYVERFVPEQLEPKHLNPALLEEMNGNFAQARQAVIAMFNQPTYGLMRMGTVSRMISAVLGSMKWQLIRFDGPRLAYSDQPIVVWPLAVGCYQPPPDQPCFGPLGALEIFAPLAPDLAVLMTWADEPDVYEPVEAEPVCAGEMNALVIAQADKQWMHKPGAEPIVAKGLIRPLSRTLEHGYTASTARRSQRRAAAKRRLRSNRDKRFIEVVTVR